MIVLKILMITITIFLLISNNYREDENDTRWFVNFVLIMYIAVILFG